MKDLWYLSQNCTVICKKLKELEMGQMDLKAGYTMCLYYLGKHPEGLTATQLTELCKEDKAAISVP